MMIDGRPRRASLAAGRIYRAGTERTRQPMTPEADVIGGVARSGWETGRVARGTAQWKHAATAACCLCSTA